MRFRLLWSMCSHRMRYTNIVTQRTHEHNNHRRYTSYFSLNAFITVFFDDLFLDAAGSRETLSH